MSKIISAKTSKGFMTLAILLLQAGFLASENVAPTVEANKDNKVYVAWSAGINPYAKFTPVQKDWSSYDTFRISIYSPKICTEKMRLMFEQNSTGPVYYASDLTIDWSGWKTLDLPFKNMLAVRNPEGWGKIETIQLVSKFDNNVASNELKVFIGEMMLVKLCADGAEQNKILPVEGKFNYGTSKETL